MLFSTEFITLEVLESTIPGNMKTEHVKQYVLQIINIIEKNAN
jgi:hypothetical protein